MISSLNKWVRLRVERTLAQLLEQRRSGLYTNAYALVLNQAASAGFGLLYWMVAAHLYSVEVVGKNSALISTLMLLGTIATLGLGSAVIRFLPRWGTHSTQLVIRVYGANVIAAVLISLLFLQVDGHFGLTASLLGEESISHGWLVIAAAVWTVFYVQDSVLIGLRQAAWVLIENSLFNLAKIVLLLVGVQMAHEYGIALSWFLPAVAMVALTNGLIFWRLLPRHLAAGSVTTVPITARQALPSVTGDYLGSLLSDFCVRLLPLLVVTLLGNSAGAYFYQAWLVSTFLFLFASNMVSSFTVEAAASPAETVSYSRRILREMVYVIVPMVVVAVVAAPQILGLFGAAYAQEGVPLLRWLAIAALPAILNTWYLGYARVRAYVVSIVISQGAISVLTLGLSYWWLPTMGISSIGIAWLVSHTFVAILVAVKMSPLLLGNAGHEQADQAVSRSHLWRRSDWRFLSSTPRPRKSAVFAQGLLAESVAAISEHVIDCRGSRGSECDLAVAVNPDRATLRAARDALGEGGVCYTEWAAWRMGGAWGIRRRLRAAGFCQVQLWWPYPTPVLARFWLPVPARIVACRYLARQLPFSVGFVQHVALSVVARLAQFVLWLGFVPHLSAITYKGNGCHEDLFSRVREQWTRAHMEDAGDDLSFLVHTGGPLLRNKIICLVLAGEDSTPRWVVKMARVPGDTQTLRHEFDILSRLRRANAGTGVELVLPLTLDFLECNGVSMSLQTFLSGHPLQRHVTRTNYGYLATQLTDWQITLAKRYGDRTRRSDIGAVISRFLDGLDSPSDPLLDAHTIAGTRETLSALGPVPVVCAHNDFTPWNLIWTDIGLGAIDWGDAEWDGIPMLDLVYALAILAAVLDKAWDPRRMQAAYRGLMDVNTPGGAVFHRELDRYAREVGLQPDQIPPLRLLTWVLHSNFVCRGKAEQGVKATLPRSYTSVCIPLWRAELQMQLGSKE